MSGGYNTPVVSPPDDIDDGTEAILLEPEYWDSVIGDVFQQFGAQLPSPEWSKVAVLVKDGKMVGFLVGQPAMHFEPMWIARDYRGKVNWKKMVTVLEATLPKGTIYYSNAPNRRMEEICRQAGMTETKWNVFYKEIK